MLKDGKFLLIACTVIITLIWVDIPDFLKSLVTHKIVSAESIKETASNSQNPGWKVQEKNFWSSLKEIDFEAAETPEEKEPETPKEKQNQQKNQIKTSRKPEKTYSKFLFLGDSTMYEIAIATQNDLLSKYQIKNTRLDYKISTGLNRIDVYNWYDRTENLLKSYKPDVLFVIFGGNDDQDIKDFQGKYRTVLTDEWKKAYRERVEKYAKLVSSFPVRKIYWIGQPISEKPHYNQYFQIFNKIYEEVCQKYPKMEFIPTWYLMSVNGKYAPILADKSGEKGYVKAADGIHLTPHGAQIISDNITEIMRKDKILKPKPKQTKPPKKEPTI